MVKVSIFRYQFVQYKPLNDVSKYSHVKEYPFKKKSFKIKEYWLKEKIYSQLSKVEECTHRDHLCLCVRW